MFRVDESEEEEQEAATDGRSLTYHRTAGTTLRVSLNLFVILGLLGFPRSFCSFSGVFPGFGCASERGERLMGLVSEDSQEGVMAFVTCDWDFNRLRLGVYALWW